MCWENNLTTLYLNEHALYKRKTNWKHELNKLWLTYIMMKLVVASTEAIPEWPQGWINCLFMCMNKMNKCGTVPKKKALG